MTGVEHSARVDPSGERFTLRHGEYILDAALRYGVPLRYGCRHGNCSSCKYLVTNGDVDHGNASPYSLSNAERDEGWVLVCCATALEDLEIQDSRPVDERRLSVLAPREYSAEVSAVDRLTPTLYRLRIDTDDPVTFYAGQFLEMEVPGSDGKWRSYSIASAPDAAPEMAFVIKAIGNGAFSGVLPTLQRGDRLRVRGPFGTGYLREGDRPVLLVATGSGISPILSILEHAAVTEDKRPFTFFYGARTANELPAQERIAELGKLLDLSCHVTLSQPTPDCRWTGRPARVTTAVLREVDDGTPYDAYLCGKPEMCEAVTALLEAKGTPEDSIFSDKFFPAVTE